VDEVEFGRYRLLSLIGEGGMGKVYKAHDTVMDRDVAIKVLPPEMATEPGYEQRFRRDAVVTRFGAHGLALTTGSVVRALPAGIPLLLPQREFVLSA
jgi:serine/threonine protein kinase